MKCRICHNEDLKMILDLGHQPLADRFLTKDQLREPETYYPLDVWMCNECGLPQLGYVVPREILYQDAYPYMTGQNTEGVKHFRQLAMDTVDSYNLGSNDLVVDIGSNDGTLLKGFKDFGCKVYGVEPNEEIALMASRNNEVESFVGFWGEYVASFLWAGSGKAKVITATNVFAHVDDLHEFMRAIDMLLADDGVFIIEAPNWYDLLRQCAYDTIYHEHLSYLHPKPVAYLVGQYGMMIDHVKHVPIHGGTVRYTIVRGDNDFQCNNPDVGDFGNLVEGRKGKLLNLIKDLRAYGDRGVGVSAPAKGNTLLNYCGIGPEILDYITEKSPLKVGKYTPGKHIPVISDDYLELAQPEFALLLAWNFQDQIIGKHPKYKGKWIIPIPEPTVIQGY